MKTPGRGGGERRTYNPPQKKINLITFLNNFELGVQPESNSANILSAVIEITHCEKLLCELVADAKSTLPYFLIPSYIGIIGWTYDDNIGQRFKKPCHAIFGAYNMFKKSSTGIGLRFAQKI